MNYIQLAIAVKNSKIFVEDKNLWAIIKNTERTFDMAGGNFDNAKNGKNDEFYTQLTDKKKSG